jgi:microcystin-dependent protein
MSTTTNYAWTMPTVGGDADVWGDELNTTIQAIDTQVKAVSDDIATQVAASVTPVGVIVTYPGPTSPTNWVECNGSALSRTDFATLFTVIGTSYGAGDGSTTFNIPDLRGYFVRGFDNGRGIDTGRTLASTQADAFASHDHTYETTIASGNTFPALGGGTTFSRATDSTGGSETRPKNIAMLYIIKTL